MREFRKEMELKERIKQLELQHKEAKDRAEYMGLQVSVWHPSQLILQLKLSIG